MEPAPQLQAPSSTPKLWEVVRWEISAQPASPEISLPASLPAYQRQPDADELSLCPPRRDLTHINLNHTCLLRDFHALNDTLHSTLDLQGRACSFALRHHPLPLFFSPS